MRVIVYLSLPPPLSLFLTRSFFSGKWESVFEFVMACVNILEIWYKCAEMHLSCSSCPWTSGKSCGLYDSNYGNNNHPWLISDRMDSWLNVSALIQNHGCIHSSITSRSVVFDWNFLINERVIFLVLSHASSVESPPPPTMTFLKKLGLYTTWN